ncbi:hypothetical protein LB505_000789 [Fusarium chuoi]|nr:hypothetical protein LB505_000789 [Fusarium chuoi]
MPRRWFSDRLHDAWGRVAGRRGRQRDQESQSSQHYAEIVAAPDESPDRANHLHLRRGASLPDLLARAALGHKAFGTLQHLPFPLFNPSQAVLLDLVLSSGNAKERHLVRISILSQRL